MLKFSDTARETDSHSGLTGWKGHLQQSSAGILGLKFSVGSSPPL